MLPSVAAAVLLLLSPAPAECAQLETDVLSAVEVLDFRPDTPQGLHDPDEPCAAAIRAGRWPGLTKQLMTIREKASKEITPGSQNLGAHATLILCGTAAPNATTSMIAVIEQEDGKIAVSARTEALCFAGLLSRKDPEAERFANTAFASSGAGPLDLRGIPWEQIPSERWKGLEPILRAALDRRSKGAPEMLNAGCRAGTVGADLLQRCAEVETERAASRTRQFEAAEREAAAKKATQEKRIEAKRAARKFVLVIALSLIPLLAAAGILLTILPELRYRHARRAIGALSFAVAAPAVFLLIAFWISIRPLADLDVNAEDLLAVFGLGLLSLLMCAISVPVAAVAGAVLCKSRRSFAFTMAVTTSTYSVAVALLGRMWI